MALSHILLIDILKYVHQHLSRISLSPAFDCPWSSHPATQLDPTPTHSTSTHCCIVGKKSEEEGQTSCEACPADNGFSSTSGSSTCDTCIQGYFRQDDECNPCSGGMLCYDEGVTLEQVGRGWKETSHRDLCHGHANYNALYPY